MALISVASFVAPRLRRRLYATNSTNTAVNAEASIDSIKATAIVIKSFDPVSGSSSTENPITVVVVSRDAKVPIIKTSE